MEHNYRIWNTINYNKTKFYYVNSVEDAIEKIKQLMKKNSKNSKIFASFFGLEEKENNKYSEWTSEEDLEIMDFIDEE